MLSMNDLKVGVVVTQNGAPYQIIRAEHSKQARSAAVLRVKMKNLITGQVLDKTFQQGDSVPLADLGTVVANFQYCDAEGFHFMHNETFDQFVLSDVVVGDAVNYMIEGEDVKLLSFEGKPVAVELPPKVVLTVVEAPPSVRGDSASNVTKKVKCETGCEVSVPLFINQGEKIRVNTQTGEYVERA